MEKSSMQKVEFGDFQTPKILAKDIILAVEKKGTYAAYDAIIEPTCGLGSFLEAFLEYGADASQLEGWEINPNYVELANKTLQALSGKSRKMVQKKDFFTIDWLKLKNTHAQPVLFIGNPPWVTNSELGKLLSKNLPEKYNFQHLNGLEAITGKSNFDISEWMLIKLLHFISGTESSIAFLIKTSVARKLFQYIAKHKLQVTHLSMREIDAKKHFKVNVDACLFMADGTTTYPKQYICPLYDEIESPTPYKTMGVFQKKLVADITAYKKLAHFDQPSPFKWRSGVKHDAAKIMELTLQPHQQHTYFINGVGEKVNIETDHLYPMYKSSHIAKEVIAEPIKYMLVTQRKIGNETKQIATYAPKTWQYLLKHAVKLDGRKSVIYKNAPRFAIFGVGDYTFLPWKIVISGLYKNLLFTKIDIYKDKPIIVDDTCYMLGFEYEEQADFVLQILTSDVCHAFIKSLIFMDSKRPITIALLNRINIQAIAESLNLSATYDTLFTPETPQLKLL